MRLTSTQVDLSTLKTGQYELDYELDSDYLAGQEATELLGGHIKALPVWICAKETLTSTLKRKAKFK